MSILHPICAVIWRDKTITISVGKPKNCIAVERFTTINEAQNTLRMAGCKALDCENHIFVHRDERDNDLPQMLLNIRDRIYA